MSKSVPTKFLNEESHSGMVDWHPHTATAKRKKQSSCRNDIGSKATKDFKKFKIGAMRSLKKELEMAKSELEQTKEALLDEKRARVVAEANVQDLLERFQLMGNSTRKLQQLEGGFSEGHETYHGRHRRSSLTRATASEMGNNAL